MQVEYEDAKQLTRDIVSIIRRHLPDPAYRIFFFGSRVSGKGHVRSDIDVGIEGPEAAPYAAIEDIREEIEELPTLYKIDIVDFKRLPEKFRRVASERAYIEEPALSETI